MARLPTWRRTGRAAGEGHFKDLNEGSLVEFPGYDNRGHQQGNLLGYLVSPADQGQIRQGKVFHMHVLAIEDGYYEYWYEQTYGAYTVERTNPVHFCGVSAQHCSSHAIYRNPVHIDVFRLLDNEHLKQLRWLTATDKARIEAYPAFARPVPPVPEGIRPEGAVRSREGEAVADGMEGIDGLARALGLGALDNEGDRGEEKGRKREKPGQDEPKSSSSKAVDSEGMLEEIKARTPPDPKLSALDLPKTGKKKKKRKEKKSLQSVSSSSSTDSLFRSAALPKGMERLREIHQKKPGSLASLTLRRCEELLSRSQGGGTAQGSTLLPPVMRAYLHQIYMQSHPQVELGLRTSKEMKTLATAVDYICQNDTLRALDLLVQRIKALELAHSQGSWTQASQIELIQLDDQTAISRQEIKAAQQEVKADYDLQRGPRPRWTRWSWSEAGEGGADQAEEKTSDKPPVNNQRPFKGKGKGKGKKGKWGRK